MNKYHARRTTVDGITFDSQKEANRYCELKLLKRAGVVADFERQPRLQLQPGFKKPDGAKVNPIYYVADFKVIYPDGKIEYEDTKGVETKEFLLKKKLLEYQYPDLVLKVF